MPSSSTPVFVFALILAACAGAGGETTTTTTTDTTSTAAFTTTTAASETSTTANATEQAASTLAVEPVLSNDEGTYSIVWASATTPFWDPNAGSAADPFFFIHTMPAADGFYFSLEMYTTGYGALWRGELGDVEIICNEASPAPNSTGICPHFDPDGPGPLGDLNADFAATGSITINQLDEGGYDIVVDEIMFSDGSSIAAFQLVGP